MFMPTSRTTKLSISSPHRTTDAYDGSSSILWYPSVLSIQIASCWILARCSEMFGVTHLYNFRTYRSCQRITSGDDRGGGQRTKSLELFAPAALPCRPPSICPCRESSSRKQSVNSDNGGADQLKATRVLLIRPEMASPVCPAALNKKFPSKTADSIQWRLGRSTRMNVGGIGYRDRCWQSDKLADPTRVLYSPSSVYKVRDVDFGSRSEWRKRPRVRASVGSGGLGGEEQSVQIGGSPTRIMYK